MRKFFSPLVRKGSERRTPRRRGSSTSAASVGAPQLRPHSTGPDHIYTAFAEQGSEAGGTLRREIDDARSRLQSLPELSFRASHGPAAPLPGAKQSVWHIACPRCAADPAGRRLRPVPSTGVVKVNHMGRRQRRILRLRGCDPPRSVSSNACAAA